MYNYFVSYQLKDNKGFGNHELGLTTKIKSMKDIKEVSRYLEEVLELEKNSLAIMNFQLFD